MAKDKSFSELEKEIIEKAKRAAKTQEEQEFKTQNLTTEEVQADFNQWTSQYKAGNTYQQYMLDNKHAIIDMFLKMREFLDERGANLLEVTLLVKVLSGIVFDTLQEHIKTGRITDLPILDSIEQEASNARTTMVSLVESSYQYFLQFMNEYKLNATYNPPLPFSKKETMIN